MYGFLKQFYVGMLTTCGLTMPAATGRGAEPGRTAVQHPHFHVSAEWPMRGGGGQAFREIRQSAVFSDNLVMKRVIADRAGRRVYRGYRRNQGFFDSPLMILTISTWLPDAGAGAKIYSSGPTYRPGGERGKGPPRWNEIAGRPSPGGCFFHRLQEGCLHPAAQRAPGVAAVRFDPEALPMLCERKTCAGDYAPSGTWQLTVPAAPPQGRFPHPPSAR